MSINSIAEYAESCLDRECLLRWFPSSIQYNDSQLGFSGTELAIVEQILRSLSRGESLLIRNPLPCNRIPVALCLAYTRTQDPRFPTDGIVGRGQSILAFPAMSKGYLSTIDNVKLDSLGRQPSLVNREPVGQLSAIDGDADIYTAKHGFNFDRQHPVGATGAVFVDLRKPEWGQFARRFVEINDFAQRTDIPFIFYTNESSDETTKIQNSIDSIEVTSRLLTTAEGMDVPNPGQTARFGHLLSEEEFAAEYISVGFPKMKNIIKDLVQMKQDLQERSVATTEVGWLFNLLTKLPVRPEHWDDVTSDHYYQQGVNELLQTLKQRSSRFGGMDADLLLNYCHAADQLHGLLNRENPIQTELFDLIREAEEQEIDRAFVVRNDSERQAILRAITIDGGPTPSSAAIRDLSAIDAGEFDEVVVCRPLDYDSYVYEFPLAPEMKFLQFQSWAEVVQRRVDRGLDVLDAETDLRRVGQFADEQNANTTAAAPPTESQAPTESTVVDEEPGDTADRELREPTASASEPVADYVPDVKGASEVEVIETLESEFKTGATPHSDGTDRGNTDGTPDLQITLDNGEVKTVSEHARVTILQHSGDIGRIQAADLSVGDTVVLVDSAAKDIYDMFLESAHEKKKLRKCESIVERWQTALEGYLQNATTNELLDELQERGSDITDPNTIELWAEGTAIGPRDPDDVRRVLAVVDPEMEPTWEATVQAMKDIRTEHQQIGKQARQAIESKMSSSMVNELSESLEDGFDRSEVTKTTVAEITQL